MVQSEIRQVEEELSREKSVDLSCQGAWMKWNLPESYMESYGGWNQSEFHSCLEESLSTTEAKPIRFVREEDTGHVTKSRQHFMFDNGSELNMRVDIGKKFVFPECVQTTLHIVVWSQSPKMIVAIELKVPWEEGKVPIVDDNM
ncbi:Hypothetical predicted protein [Mytilus galloprovincialis]|uniref:Uncharacterized protein n=1 Tax=Mytilus galloprovincialis TaxID=29158 RepID=A0A8B6HMT9_MYTGA|nr:Hypothetical predicted protein [Mytilus galloprovincialis]